MSDLARGVTSAAALDPVAAPEVTILVPCLNEELTVGTFVAWCFEGLEQASVTGEVLIVDSSTDRSAEIAAAHGARVLDVPKRGLGRAYIDAIPHVRGEIVIMGDCDLTYDFRELAGFVAAVRAGNEFVMGTRTKGYIEPDAMPRLHRYFGSPATTWIFNRIYGTRFSDIHCGMRAMTLDALRRMELESQGWEYASEMILKARKRRFRTTEVPVRFYKDPPGRESHLVRSGWKEPWRAGWNSLRIMFLYAPDYFLLWPGAILLTLGILVSAALAAGDVNAFGVGFDLHWMLLGLVLAILGYSALQLAVLARVHYDFDPKFTARVFRILSYNGGMAAAGLLTTVGLVPNVSLLVSWVRDGFALRSIDHPAVFGLTLVVLGFQTFAFTLLVHIIGRRHVDRPS
ncbi:MAG: glycosyl transferase family 2 [Conexibacter sp.]|jgi:glycosyltransferase involved in cell wall biosynthesis|nr:glycosyl transferase family 2 [Conexibacter sp.]